MEPVLDYRIFGVPERMEWIERNKEILGLPPDRIILDPEHEGCLATARRAWSVPARGTHVVVLSDDVELCVGFTDYSTRIARAHPDEIISLFPIQFSDRRSVSRYPRRSPYVETKSLSGAGIMMKAEYVEPCLAFWREERTGDDTNIQAWAKTQGIQILTTLPAILDHIGLVSVHDPTRTLGGTAFFDRHPGWANWDDPYVTPWTNVV